MLTKLIRKLSGALKRQEGMALLAVLAMFAVGSLLIIPSINYVTTNLKAGSMAKQDFRGITAADAAIEDALWKIKNDMPSSFPYSYGIADINNLSVDVEIDEVNVIAGVPLCEPAHHAEWLQLDADVTYDYGTGNYTYTISANNTGTSKIKIYRILIDFPVGVDYVEDSTTSNLTKPLDMNPTSICGSAASGITLVWENGTPRPNISAGDTEYHIFKLSGPPGISGIQGHGFVEAKRSDMAAVWIGDITPYSITAKAKDSSGKLIAEIKAGVWGCAGYIEVSCWQVVH
jgi:Tfp pilus assembly protein PilX